MLRPFNVYGPRQTGEGAIRNFCVAAVTGAPLEIYGDGSAVRAWCYVDDFVAAALSALTFTCSRGADLQHRQPRRRRRYERARQTDRVARAWCEDQARECKPGRGGLSNPGHRQSPQDFVL